MHKILLICLLLLTTGCAIQQRKNNQLAEQLRLQSPEPILASLQKTLPDETDFAQYYLNVGYLQLLSGDVESAIVSLTDAKQEMKSLSALSVSENIAAGTVNETFRRYSGYPTDHVMVHNMLALAYLFNDNIEGARVEMLQADISMEKLAEGNTLQGPLASTHLLSAIIYELLDERSNAFISYRWAENAFINRQLRIPTGVKLGLLRTSKKMGNEAEYSAYSKKYASLVSVANANKQVFNLHFDGVVANKIERSVTVPTHDNEQLVHIAVPAYPKESFLIHYATVQADEEKITTELVDNIDTLVREDLAQAYPSILLLTTTRAVAKYQLVDKAREQDSLAGMLLNIATVLSEVADLRSWNMLPATVQFAYLETDGASISISTLLKEELQIPLYESKQHLILSTSLSDKIFHYHQ